MDDCWIYQVVMKNRWHACTPKEALQMLIRYLNQSISKLAFQLDRQIIRNLAARS
jgi:hypothetical protein